MSLNLPTQFDVVTVETGPMRDVALRLGLTGAMIVHFRDQASRSDFSHWNSAAGQLATARVTTLTRGSHATALPEAYHGAATTLQGLADQLDELMRRQATLIGEWDAKAANWNAQHSEAEQAATRAGNDVAQWERRAAAGEGDARANAAVVSSRQATLSTARSNVNRVAIQAQEEADSYRGQVIDLRTQMIDALNQAAARLNQIAGATLTTDSDRPSPIAALNTTIGGLLGRPGAPTPPGVTITPTAADHALIAKLKENPDAAERVNLLAVASFVGGLSEALSGASVSPEDVAVGVANLNAFFAWIASNPAGLTQEEREATLPASAQEALASLRAIQSSPTAAQDFLAQPIGESRASDAATPTEATLPIGTDLFVHERLAERGTLTWLERGNFSDATINNVLLPLIHDSIDAPAGSGFRSWSESVQYQPEPIQVSVLVEQLEVATGRPLTGAEQAFVGDLVSYVRQPGVPGAIFDNLAGTVVDLGDHVKPQD